MLRTVLLALLVVLAPAQAMAAACQGYDVGTFLSDSPYLVNRMQVTGESTAERIELVHGDDPGISGVISLDPVTPRPVVRRSEFVNATTDQMDADIAALAAGGDTELERAIYPYDPITWTIHGRRPATNEQFGTMTMAISTDCNLHVEWRAVDNPVLASRTSEFRSAIDVMRTFAASHVEAPRFLKENTAPTGVMALLVGFLAPLLASGALFYVLSNMVQLPRPGIITRLLGLLVGFASGAALYLFMSTAETIPADILLALYGFLALSLLANLLAATWHRQDVVLSAFCLSSIAGLSFGVATYIEWISPPLHGYGAAGLLVAISAMGLWSWHRVETIRIRRRSVRSV